VICDFGDVVVVPFPFVDIPITKRRPAVVLSAETFNAENDHSVLVMITTGAASIWPSDITISDEPAAGLKHRSVVRWKVFTVPNRLVVDRIGALSGRDRAAVRRSAQAFLP
jgi:mRNA interferase MazF